MRDDLATRGASVGADAPVNGLDLYHEIHGSGRPLVLLHGGWLTIDLTFGRIIPTLAGSHRVIALEFQGHGHTTDTDRPMALEHLADDVIGLLGYLDVEEADFFGFSLGGVVALGAFRRYPYAVGKLVIASVDLWPAAAGCGRLRPVPPRRICPTTSVGCPLSPTSRRCAMPTPGLHPTPTTST
jgi:pimeloyl-ACP methyl ester carboxylesterase